MVQSVQSAVDQFAGEYNKLGFSVKSVNLAGSGKSGAALSIGMMEARKSLVLSGWLQWRASLPFEEVLL